MNETGWQAIGRVAKARRERLGLNQDELAQYGGPRVATVGKFERGTQASFPLRTQHQIENALGWTRGTIEDFVTAVDEGDAPTGDWEHELVAENVPDMSRPIDESAASGREVPDRDLEQAAHTLAYILRLLEPSQRAQAVRAAITAMLPMLSTSGAITLGRDLRAAYPPDGGDGNAEESRGSAPTSESAGGIDRLAHVLDDIAEAGPIKADDESADDEGNARDQGTA